MSTQRSPIVQMVSRLARQIDGDRTAWRVLMMVEQPSFVHTNLTCWMRPPEYDR